MARKAVNTLIIDLDNTIFDWFAVWYASFEPIYSEIIRATGRPPAEIEADIRAVHSQRRTSEYTFLLEEVAALADMRAADDVRVRFKDAIEASRQGRDRNLRLYPSVFGCLWDLKKKGVQIVAYTESMRFYSGYRLKRFGLDGVIDYLFSPEDHDLPQGVTPNNMRRLPDEYYELQVTETRHTPPRELKPNPKVLLDIIRTVGAKPEKCAYVGDSLFKDVAMARDAGVYDIHAKYGEAQSKPEYSILQRVSHWTDDDVQREAAITARGHSFEPSACLKDSFAEIFIFCEFEAFPNALGDSAEQEIKNGLEVWKKTVDVQQHFNDLEMRVRNFAITFVAALIVAAGFTYQQNLEVIVFGHRLAAGLGLLIAAFIPWTAFFLMDRYWYHVLLKGAVTHASKIEDSLKDKVPGIALSQTISDVSGKVKILGRTMNSDSRVTYFYFAGYMMLIVVLIALFFAAPNRPAASATSLLPAHTKGVPTPPHGAAEPKLPGG